MNILKQVKTFNPHNSGETRDLINGLAAKVEELAKSLSLTLQVVESTEHAFDLDMEDSFVSVTRSDSGAEVARRSFADIVRDGQIALEEK